MKINLNVKDFDYKQFFLQRGEWIGLGVALAISLPVLASGVMKALGSGSARTNADEVARLSKSANDRIRMATPPADADKPPPESDLEVKNNLVNPREFTTEVAWFVPSAIEDTKRRNPEILPASDAVAVVVRGGVMENVIHPGKVPQVEVMRDKQRVLSPKERKLIEKLRKLGINIGQPGGQAPGGGGMPPGGMGGMMGGRGGMMGGMGGMMGGGMGGMMGGGGMGGMMGGGQRGGGGKGGLGQEGGGGAGQMLPGAATSGPKQIFLVDINKLKDERDVQLAQQLDAGRMVMVSAAFPYKQQLDMFRIALRKKDLNELVGSLNSDDVPWRFTGIEIERRVLDARGQVLDSQLRVIDPQAKPESGWVPRYDKAMLTRLKGIMATVAAVEPDKEIDELHSKYEGMINSGIVWARPHLELGEYPKLEVPGIKDAMQQLDKQMEETHQRPPSSLAQKLKGENIDPTDPFNTIGKEEENKTESAEQPAAGEKKPGEKEGKEGEPEPVLPEKALVQFLDATVIPGYTYEYRFRVKMANPNYNKEASVAYPKLAKEKELVASEWTAVPRVTVPNDIHWYAMDERADRERTIVQIHRWVDVTTNDPQNARATVPVADWLVLERAVAHRGEYIGHVQDVAVPTWNKEADGFELARNPKTKLHSLPVDFTVRDNDRSPPALLVDYDGGKGQSIKYNGKVITDDTPLQLLVLNSDGRLSVRFDDKHEPNKEREERLKKYKERLDNIRKGIKKPGQGLFDKSSMPGGGGGVNP